MKRSERAHKSQKALKEFSRDRTGYNNPGGEVTVKKAVKLGNMDVVKGESKEIELSVSKTKGKKSSERPSVEGIESDSEGSKMTGLLTQYSGQSPLVLITMPKQVWHQSSFYGKLIVQPSIGKTLKTLVPTILIPP